MNIYIQTFGWPQKKLAQINFWMPFLYSYFFCAWSDEIIKKISILSIKIMMIKINQGMGTKSAGVVAFIMIIYFATFMMKIHDLWMNDGFKFPHCFCEVFK